MIDMQLMTFGDRPKNRATLCNKQKRKVEAVWSYTRFVTCNMLEIDEDADCIRNGNI